MTRVASRSEVAAFMRRLVSHRMSTPSLGTEVPHGLSRDRRMLTHYVVGTIIPV